MKKPMTGAFMEWKMKAKKISLHNRNFERTDLHLLGRNNKTIKYPKPTM